MIKLEINAYNLDEAKTKAYNRGVTVISDATKEWEKAGKPTFDRQLNVFMVNYLSAKELFQFEGAGAIIVVTPGFSGWRHSPFEFKNRNTRAKNMKRMVEIRRIDNDELLGTAPNKKQAVRLAKKIVRQTELSVYGITKYVPEFRDFELIYRSGKDSSVGQYIVFGVDNGDVRLWTQQHEKFDV